MRTVTSSPHIHSKENTQRIMADVCLALLPSMLWGIYSFGFRAFFVMLFSIAGSVLTEFILGKLSGENTIWDLSAVVTGMLIGMNMSPEIPLFIPVIASIFSIAVVKWSFGGLGANWANPAIAGRLFVFFSFSSSMSVFKLPRLIAESDSALKLISLSSAKFDAISSATPLGLIKTSVNSGNFQGLSSLEILSKQNYLYSDFAFKLSEKTGWNVYNIDNFIGNVGGCIGEVSSLLLIIGAIYLLIRKVITFHIPLSYLLSFSVLTWIFGGIPNNRGFFSGEVLSSVFRGGLIIAVFFMATDMVTTPVTKKGMLIFGFGCGFFTFLFRSFGSLPEGASIAILLMNMFTPTIDKFCKPRKFGMLKKEGK